MKKELQGKISQVVEAMGIEPATVKVEYTEDFSRGDFVTNIALLSAKKLGSNPRELAERIAADLKDTLPDFVEKVEVAGPGFVNFKIWDQVFARQVLAVANSSSNFGENDSDRGKRIMVEYTDPNPFKIFHIGHLMANAVGESISRLVEYSGAKVVRACYQGDVGLHVAKTIWAILKKKGEYLKKNKELDIVGKVQLLGEMYVYGSQYYIDVEVQKEIAAINKKIFEKSDPEINAIYEEGRKASLEYFDLIYKRLGTKFDQFFFESEVAGAGVKIVEENLSRGVFAKSDGAVVFKGEDHGLHTRVFITSQGLPTYEAKEIGLNTQKFEKYPDLAESIIVTANEQNDYFHVLLKALSLIRPQIAEKTTHISHGILRFATGKMASRKGNIISAESLLEEIREMVKERIAERKFDEVDAENICDAVAVAAIKYSILRQSIGGDIIFDSASSISFDGDSGPYLQYAAVRAGSVLEKAKEQGVEVATEDGGSSVPDNVSDVERLITRFPDIVDRSRAEYAPQYVAQYLITLAGAFNRLYAEQIFVKKGDPLSPYYVALTRAFRKTMAAGLWLLGITVPAKM